VYRLESSEAERAEQEAASAAVADGSQRKGGAAGAGGYSKVHSEEQAPGSEGVELPAVQGIGPALSAEEVRRLPMEEVTQQLENLLVQVAQQGPSPLTAPLDRRAPVSALGLDSMTLVQYKGVLEKRLVLRAQRPGHTV
jgi:hypothetical protein